MYDSDKLNANDLSFYTQLYTDYRDEFLVWIKKLYTISDEDAKDIFQESIIIFRNKCLANEYDNSRASIKTYLFAIGKNTCRSWMRKNKPSVAFEDHHYVDVNDESEERFKEEKKIELVLGLIEKMKGKCKRLLSLYYIEGKRMTTIAKILELKNADTAKATKNRCMKALREHVKTSINKIN